MYRRMMRKGTTIKRRRRSIGFVVYVSYFKYIIAESYNVKITCIYYLVLKRVHVRSKCSAIYKKRLTRLLKTNILFLTIWRNLKLDWKVVNNFALKITI